MGVRVKQAGKEVSLYKQRTTSRCAVRVQVLGREHVSCHEEVDWWIRLVEDRLVIVLGVVWWCVRVV